jgi:hypothetical protein
MKNRLEEFVKQNRESFDDREPSPKLWSRIETSLFTGASFWNSLTLWRAAAIVFMCLSLYLLIPKDRISPQNRIALKEFTDVESFYVKQISEKVKLIDGFETNDGLNTFTQDFQQLEAMYLVLKEEMKTHPSQKVKDALVLNLLVQMDLLNQQLHNLEKENQPDVNTEKPKASI